MIRPLFVCFLALLAEVFLASAQQFDQARARATATLRSMGAEPVMSQLLEVPVLGYLAWNSPVRVRPILGAPGAVALGDPIPLPEAVTRLIPVPGQDFGLVESRGATELGVLPLGMANSGPVQPIPNTFPDVDIVVFSPSGKVAVLYSAALQQAEVVTGLPSSGHIVQTLDFTLTTLNVSVTSLAVSDDAQAVLAGVSDGNIGAVWLFADDQPPKQLVHVGTPSALRFFPENRDAVIADSGWQQVSLLVGLDQRPTLRLLGGLGQGIVAPSDLEISGDQNQLFVADANSGLLTINLRSESISTMRCDFSPTVVQRLGVASGYLVMAPDTQKAGVWSPQVENQSLWRFSDGGWIK